MNKIAELDLTPFLLEANLAGYANDAPEVKHLPDGAHEIVYERDNKVFHDHWWGGEPFAGQESIAVGGVVVWAMQYRGRVRSGESADRVIIFLREALKNCSPSAPYRGPRSFESGEWRYENVWTGNMDDFEGHEEIFQNSRSVYTCKYLGGLVDVELVL